MNRTNTHSPQHVAIIMDGNRRWAKKHKLNMLMGHKKAAYESIEPLIDVCIEEGISYLTIWAFSTENWNRSKEEVDGLISLFRETLSENIDKLHKKGVRVQSIGDLSKFPSDIQEKIQKGTTQTKNNKKMTLIIALNYGGRDEIIRAISKILNPELEGRNINIENFSKYLDTSATPDPDLVIRTGGERRLSGFLTWQSVYSELYFSDILFPDFSKDEFIKALQDYQMRQRRFGR